MAEDKKKRKQKKVVEGWQPKQKVASIFVDNPYYSKAHDNDTANPIKIKAQVNIKESAIATLSSRKLINEAQVMAADRFRGFYEAMGGAGAGSFDYSREPVDGGGAREPLTERQMRAALELKLAKQILGNKAYDIMTKIAGQGFAIQELASSQRERTTLTDYLKDGLDELARCWGYENKGNKRKSA